MKGGYQIIDLSDVTVGTQATIEGIYDIAGGNNGKPFMVITPDGQRVFAEVKTGTNKYVTAYLGANGSTYTVEISKANKVDITKQESSSDLDERVDDLEDRMNANQTTSAEIVSLSTDYTYNAPYVCPSDGYLSLNNGNNNTARQVVGGVHFDNGPNITFSGYFTASYNANMLFVKKGMKLYVSSLPEGSSAQFIPIHN